MSGAESPPVLRRDGLLASELHPTSGVVYLENGDGDAIRLEGDEIQRAARLLIAAHVDRGRYLADARAASTPPKGRK